VNLISGPTSPECESDAPKELTSDPTMLSLIRRYGTITLRRRPSFEVLSRSIIAQQISTKAADTIRRKMIGEFGITANRYATARIPRLRKLGLSASKAECVIRVARRSVKGEFEELDRLSNDDVSTLLQEVSGVGPWTANMFLIFSLARPDVWPVKDAGLRTAARNCYEMATDSAVTELGERFRPYRSIAALYLWRSLENVAS
jgi:DNA-3-methyladenine glycosylase II